LSAFLSVPFAWKKKKMAKGAESSAVEIGECYFVAQLEL
jgi:hypothetical protein